nr:hypothetical protein [Gemmatimonadales bacterium]
MGRIISDSGDSRTSDKGRSARRHDRLPWRVATAGLAVAAAAVLLLLSAGQPASATPGVYNAAVDVDIGTAGVQDCLVVTPGASFS